MILRKVWRHTGRGMRGVRPVGSGINSGGEIRQITPTPSIRLWKRRRYDSCIPPTIMSRRPLLRFWMLLLLLRFLTLLLLLLLLLLLPPFLLQFLLHLLLHVLLFMSPLLPLLPLLLLLQKMLP